MLVKAGLVVSHFQIDICAVFVVFYKLNILYKQVYKYFKSPLIGTQDKKIRLYLLQLVSSPLKSYCDDVAMATEHRHLIALL